MTRIWPQRKESAVVALTTRPAASAKPIRYGGGGKGEAFGSPGDAKDAASSARGATERRRHLRQPVQIATNAQFPTDAPHAASLIPDRIILASPPVPAVAIS